MEDYSDLAIAPQDYSDLAKAPSSEGFLQKVIQSNRIGTLPTTGLGMLPMNRPEMIDVGKATISSQIPSTNMGPLAWGMSMKDKRSPDLSIPGLDQFRQMMAPQTQYGKNLQMAEQVAPLALLGAQGAEILGGAIKKPFSVGNLPQEIEQTKGNIYDIIKSGKGEVKGKVGTLFDQFQKEFGARLGKIKGGMTNQEYADILDKTAQDIGAFHIEGSPGNYAKKMAESFRSMSKENSDRLFVPQEIQAQTQQILNSFGKNTMAKAKFYNHFLESLKDRVPELASLKGDYAPIYEIAKQSKKITPGIIRDASTNKIGPETLADVMQAEQMIGEEAGPVQRAMQLGDQLRGKENQLQKIIGRRDKGIKALKYIGLPLGVEELIRLLWKRD